MLWHCDFKKGNAILSFGNAISDLVMQFQIWQCNFKSGNAISDLAMQFQIWQCGFRSGNAI
jgi:hypothetical protein